MILSIVSLAACLIYLPTFRKYTYTHLEEACGQLSSSRRCICIFYAIRTTRGVRGFLFAVVEWIVLLLFKRFAWILMMPAIKYAEKRLQGLETLFGNLKVLWNNLIQQLTFFQHICFYIFSVFWRKGSFLEHNFFSDLKKFLIDLGLKYKTFEVKEFLVAFGEWFVKVFPKQDLTSLELL